MLFAAFSDRRPQEVFRSLPALTRGIAFLSLFAFLLLDFPVFAAGFFWSGASAPDLLWNTPGNWVDAAAAPPGELDSGTFALGSPMVVYLSGNTSLLGVVLSGSGGVTFSPGTSTTGGGGVLSVGSEGLLVGGSAGALSTGQGIAIQLNGDLSGGGSLVKMGDGALRLAGAGSGGFSGDVTVNGGALVLANGAALSGVSGLVSVNGVTGSGFTGGMLVLDGGGSGLTLHQGVTLSGRGPTVASAGAALLSIGNNTLNGSVVLGASSGASALAVAYGNTLVAGQLVLGSGSGTGLQSIVTGNGNLIVGGVVGGFDNTLNKFVKQTGVLQTTLWLQNTANSFLSSVRVDPSTTLRVSDGRALGLNPSSQNVELNQGILEVRADAATLPSFALKGLTLASGPGTVFLDRAVGGTGLNQTLNINTFTFGATNRTLALAGRNGYGVNLGSAGATIGVAGNGGNTTFTNNANGLVTLNGNMAVGGTDAFRMFYIQGAGETVWNGTLSTNMANAFLTGFGKAGTGMATLTGITAGGGVNGIAKVDGGVLQIGTFAVLSDPTTQFGGLQLGAGGNAGALL